MKPRQAQQEYHARAHAFDGMLERPYPEAVAPATFVELKRTGGFESSAELRDVNHRNFIRFERAYAYVIGNEGPKRRYNTLATAVVEGLNVAEVLTADRIVVRLISEHGHGTDKDQSPELSILPDGSRFENLRLLGRPVATDVCASAKALKGAHSALAKSLEPQARYIDGETMQRVQTTLTGDLAGAKPCALFDVKPERGLPPAKAGVLKVDGFGTVILGEYVVVANRRRLTMMRLELGSPIAGSFSLCVAEGNGVIPWP